MDASDEADRERLASRARDTQLVHAIRAGDSKAFGQLYDKWFDRVYDLAMRIVRNPDIAAEVAQDTFLKAWRSLDTLENPDAFGGWLLRIARNGAYNRSEREGRATAFDDQGLAMIESSGASPAGAPAGFDVADRLGRAANPEHALEDREAQSLVWQAAAALPPRDLEVLDLQLRHGLTPAEIGDVIGMNRNAANQLVHRLRGRLETAIRARVLWRDGQPSCAVLAARLHESGVRTFGADAVRVVERHVPGCAECDEKQRMRLQPAALFAAAPLLIAPQLVKQQAASALEAAGVPMQGSAFSGSALAGAGPGAGSGAGSGSGGNASGPTGSSASGPASSASGPLEGAPPHGVPSGLQAGTGAGSSAGARRLRMPLLAAAAVVIVILAVIGVAARVGDGSAPVEVASSGGAPPRGSTSSAGGTGPTTTAVAAPTSTNGPSTGVANGVGGPTSTASPVVPTTRPDAPPTTGGARATTTTTAPTTTTTAVTAKATIAVTPSSVQTTRWAMTPAAGTVTPVLSWTVTTNGTVTVEVTGVAAGQAGQVLSTTATGSMAVCPGSVVRGTCSTPNGSYPYEVAVKDAAGKVIATATATLVVDAPTIL